MEPLNGRAHLNLARIAKERGDQREAMQSIRNALKEDSRNADAYNLLAQIYLDLKRYKLSLLVCNAGLEELDPEHSGLWTTQGIVFLKLKDVINATRSFREAIKFDDKNFAARLNLGLITFNYRDYERSYQLLSEAVAIQPDNAEALIAKSVAARALNRIDEAKQGYQKALSLKDNHPSALFNLAVIQQDYTEVQGFDARTQNVQEAIRQLENVLNFSQDPKLRKKVVNRIEEAKLMIEAIMVEKEAAAEQ
jgi:tetratricopeptide (TPR) repeat protein